jgi:hypothetical protein
MFSPHGMHQQARHAALLMLAMPMLRWQQNQLTMILQDRMCGTWYV